MHDTASKGKRFATVAVVIALTLGGCETTSNWLKGRRTADPADPVILGAPEANTYLSELHRLAEGDPATQAEIAADAESTATLTPGTSTRLRYALVLALPGHAASDPVRSESILRDLLARPELMTASEISLATVFLKEVESRIVLDTETRRLRDASRQAASSEQAAMARRIATVEAENRELKESLAETEAKLDAITTIERSMRENSGDNDTP